MKINEVHVGNVQKKYLEHKKQHGNVKNRRRDTMSISEQAQDIQKLKNKLDSIPDIREEKVEKIKTAVNNNEYQVSSKKIAQKIMSSLEDS